MSGWNSRVQGSKAQGEWVEFWMMQVGEMPRVSGWNAQGEWVECPG